MKNANYQVTLYGEIMSKVVSTFEEAKILKAKVLEDYWNCYEDGFIDNFDRGAVALQKTNKPAGEW